MFDEDPQADWYATADESVASVTDLYRRAWAFTDEAIDTLPLGTAGRVPWWRYGSDVTLFRLVVHVTDETARHAGHADILRELTDHTVGLRDGEHQHPRVEGRRRSPSTSRSSRTSRSARAISVPAADSPNFGPCPSTRSRPHPSDRHSTPPPSRRDPPQGTTAEVSDETQHEA